MAPWIVELERGSGFCRNLFTAGDAPRHLWDHEAGYFLRSNATFDSLRDHFRRFTGLKTHERQALLRLADPAFAYTILDYLAGHKSEAAGWFWTSDGAQISSVVTRHRRPTHWFVYRPDFNQVRPEDAGRRNGLGLGYVDLARQEREVLTSVQLAGKLRTDLPPSCLLFDDATLLDRIRGARAAANAYGLREPAELGKFVFLGVVCAPYFWREPEAAAFLKQRRAKPDARFRDFYKLVARRAQTRDVPWRLPEG